MTDYGSIKETYVFSDRMERVYRGVLSRLRPNREREDTKTCPVEIENQNPFADVFEEMPDAPYVLALANAIVRSWEMTPKLIFPGEAVVGITRPDFPILEHFSWGIRINGDLYRTGEAKPSDTPLTEEEKAHFDALRTRMTPLSWRHLETEGERIFGKDEFYALNNDGMFSAGGYQGHTVPSYPRLLEYGLDGVLALVDRYAAEHTGDAETENFYEACRIILRGMSAWLSDYAREAERLAAAEQDAQQKRWYLEIAENCRFVSHKKPETLYQAVQLHFCLFLWDWCDCVGRMDQYLYPFFARSRKEGDVVGAEDAVTSLVFKLWENGSHNITLGGLTKDGTDAANELTYFLLQNIRTLHDTHPRMTVRFHRNSPKELMRLVVQLWSEGMSDPTVVSDETVIPGLTKLEITEEDARDYTILGCQEIEIPGKSNTGCEDGVFNIAKVLEYTLHNGRSTGTPSLRPGLETGEFVDFETFDDFYEAFRQQLCYFTKHFLTLCSRGQEQRAANYAKLVKAPFTEGCLEKGIPHDSGGPVYNHGCVETCGASASADALLAIRKLVFEEKKIGRQELMDALDADFAGYERVRQLLLNAPKFGNDDPEADEMASRVLDLFWTEIGKYRSVRGGIYTGACSLLEGGIHYGHRMGAFPDGCHRGEALGNTIGPRPGNDVRGVTALFRSVAKLPLQKGVGGTTLNVVLPARLLSDEEKRQSIGAAVEAYLMNGGQMAQITTADLDELLDAKEHPERHQDLIVRIGGFSIQFVQLGGNAQDEIISRYRSVS